MSSWNDAPAARRPWQAVHHPNGSVIQPEGSTRSILVVSNGTPCLSKANADLIVAAVNGRNVAGSCPMGCGETLFLGTGGYVTCSQLKCDKPDAATDLLMGGFKRLIDELAKKARIDAGGNAEAALGSPVLAESRPIGVWPAAVDAGDR